MIFNIKNESYIIDFKHDINHGICIGELYNYNKTNKEKDHIFTKSAFCANVDHYNKDVGRKVVLKRLLKDFTIFKETRQKFWQQYFEQTNKPFKNKKDAKRSSNQVV